MAVSVFRSFFCSRADVCLWPQVWAICGTCSLIVLHGQDSCILGLGVDFLYTKK